MSQVRRPVVLTALLALLAGLLALVPGVHTPAAAAETSYSVSTFSYDEGALVKKQSTVIKDIEWYFLDFVPTGNVIPFGNVRVAPLPDGAVRVIYRHLAPVQGSSTCVDFAGRTFRLLRGDHAAIFRLPLDGSQILGYGGSDTTYRMSTDGGPQSTAVLSFGAPFDFDAIDGVYEDRGTPESREMRPGEELWVDVKLPTGTTLDGWLSTASNVVSQPATYNAAYFNQPNNSCDTGAAPNNVHWVKNGNVGAIFSADAMAATPGKFWMHPLDTAGTHTWDFGDGSVVDTGFQPQHQYTKPGTFTVTHCRTDLAGKPCATQVVKVAAPTLTATITPVDETGTPLPDDHVFSVGDTVRLRERIKADDDGVGAIKAITPADGEWLDPSDALQPVTEPEDLPETLTLQPGQTQEWLWTYTITKAGRMGAGVSLDAKDAADRAIETVEGSWVDSVTGLLVEVESAWPDDGTGEAPEFQRDNNGDGIVDQRDNVLTVTVKVTNLLDDTVRTVEPTVANRPIDFRNRRTGAAVAMRDLEGSDYSAKLGTLAKAGQPGASKEVVLKYLATGDVDAFADAHYQGIPDAGGLAKGLGTKIVRFGSHLALQAKIDVEDRSYISGAPVRVQGSLTNLLQDRVREDGTTEEAPDLAVVLTPLLDDYSNAGGGYVFPATYGGPTPIGVDPIMVPAGETLDIKAIVATQQKEQSSTADFHYLVRAWAKDPEHPDQLAEEIDVTRIDVVDDADFSPEQRVRLAPNPILPDGTEKCGSASDLTQIFSCQLITGLASAAIAIKDVTFLTLGGIATGVDAYNRLKLWELQMIGTTFRSLAGDEAATRKLSAEITTQLATWVEAGIISRDALAGVGGAIAGMVKEGDRVFTEGDLEAMTGYIGQFIGENPDLALTALAKARGLRAIAAAGVVDEAAKDAAVLAAREANEAAGRKAAEELVPKIEAEVKAGRNPAESGILKGAEDVTDVPQLWGGVYGNRAVDLQNVLKIAKKHNVLVAWRGRAAIARAYLERGIAYLKPMDVKTKNVNAIDVRYIEYPGETYGRVALVDPPSPVDWRAGYEMNLKRLSTFERDAAKARFEKSVDDYMTKLRGNPRFASELDDPVWFAEVRGRVAQRGEEFAKEIKNFKRYRDEGIILEFGYGEQGLPRSLDIGGQELRKAKVKATKFVDSFGETRNVYDLKMADASGGNFKWITGDIDIVAILTPDRKLLTDPIKRKAVYDDLRELLGMQHGETFTYILEQVQAKLLRDHTIKKGSTKGAEALLVGAPDQRVRTSFLDERLSTPEEVAAGSPASTFHMLSGGPSELYTDVAKETLPIEIEKWATVYDRLDKVNTFLLPSKWLNFVDGLEPEEVAAEFNRDSAMIRPDGKGGLEEYSPAGTPAATKRTFARAMAMLAAPADPIIDDAGAGEESTGEETDFDETVAEIVDAGVDLDPTDGPGAMGGSWKPVTLASALARGTGGKLDVRPVVSMPNDAAKGARSLRLSTPAQLGLRPATPWFRPGDRIVLDPGGENEELATVASANAATGALGLTRPLTLQHFASETVLLVQPVATGGPIVAGPVRNACTTMPTAQPGQKATRLKARLVKRSVARGTRGKVLTSATYRAKPRTWRKATGPVVVCRGTTVLKATRLGKRPKRITLPVLAPGTHTLSVRYLGGVKGKPKLKVVRLTVRRR